MNRLKSIRKSKGISQAKLAEMAGLSPSVIAMIETGDRTGSVETWQKISIALNVEMSELVEQPKNGVIDSFVQRLVEEGFIVNNEIPDDVAQIIINEIQKNLVLDKKRANKKK